MAAIIRNNVDLIMGDEMPPDDAGLSEHTMLYKFHKHRMWWDRLDAICHSVSIDFIDTIHGAHRQSY